MSGKGALRAICCIRAEGKFAMGMENSPVDSYIEDVLSGNNVKGYIHPHFFVCPVARAPWSWARGSFDESDQRSIPDVAPRIST